MIFFEHQTIANINKPERPKNVAQHYIIFGPNLLSILHGNHGGEVQTNHGNHEVVESTYNVNTSIEMDEIIKPD